MLPQNWGLGGGLAGILPLHDYSLLKRCDTVAQIGLVVSGGAIHDRKAFGRNCFQ
jgi:hypothetical protein